MRVLAASAIALAAMMAWSYAMAEDVHILGFRFGCETPDGEKRKPKFGDVGGAFFTDLPNKRKPCLETIDRMIYSCTVNTTFISHDLNRTYADCLPIFEKQAQECIVHFDLQRAKCNASGDDVNREAHASDTRPDEDDTGDTGEYGSSVGDAWKPWEDEAASDDSDDEQWVDIAGPNEEYEPDDGGGGECGDVWADCPVDTYWTKEQQEGARRVELWVNFADPQANAGTHLGDEGWGHEAVDATGESGDAADSAREDYEDCLGACDELQSDESQSDYASALAETMGETPVAAVNQNSYQVELENLEAERQAQLVEAERQAQLVEAERLMAEAERQAQLVEAERLMAQKAELERQKQEVEEAPWQAALRAVKAAAEELATFRAEQAEAAWQVERAAWQAEQAEAERQAQQAEAERLSNVPLPPSCRSAYCSGAVQ